MKHIVCFSGGHSSGHVAIEVAAKYGTDDLILVNNNISSRMEDSDIKRFKIDISAYIGVPVTYCNIDGIEDENEIPTQYDICYDENAITNPNTHGALCSYRLKTKPFHDWLASAFPNGDAIVYYGFDNNEIKRIDRRMQILGALGYKTDFPLAFWDLRYSCTEDVGISRPNVYSAFKHANCMGCLKAGLLHWYVVYCVDRDNFNEAAKMEEDLGYTIQSVIRDGKTIQMSLNELAPIFCQLRASGVRASEHQSSVGFAHAVRKLGIEPPSVLLPCECITQ